MQTHFEQLQKQYPTFRYVGFLHELDGSDLRLTFAFEIGEHKFFPKSIFKGVSQKQLETISKEELDLFVFHLGLAEIPSYWKLTCSPTVIIEAGFLGEMQISFWRKLIQKGMGEFFFVNDVKPFAPQFKIGDVAPHFLGRKEEKKKHMPSHVLVPVGGGKDSIVTLELLTQTPFSSIVAFTSLFAATLFEIPYIALSNEGSANEETGVYQGVNINHQYSKTFEFESDFHTYVSTCFQHPPLYFSFLRPLFEIQIMKIFTQFPEYFASFRSCNIGKKKNEWCGTCAKCLFVSLLLSAFLPAKKVTEIFGKDMLSDPELISVLKQLTGDAQMKAFECVGTTEETMLALFLSYKKRQLEKPLPALLQEYVEHLTRHEKDFESKAKEILTTFDTRNLMPESFIQVLHNAISK